MSSRADDLDILTYVAAEPEATLIVSVLKDEEIDAAAEGTLTTGFRAEAPGEVRIMVRHQDLNRAKQVLADLRRASAEIDWSEVDVGEPE